MFAFHLIYIDNDWNVFAFPSQYLVIKLMALISKISD